MTTPTIADAAERYRDCKQRSLGPFMPDLEALADYLLRIMPPGPRPSRMLVGEWEPGTWAFIVLHGEVRRVHKFLTGTIQIEGGSKGPSITCPVYPTEAAARLARWHDRWAEYLAFVDSMKEDNRVSTAD